MTAPTTALPDELVLGSEELETLLHVLGDAAALPARLAPQWPAQNAEHTDAIRRTAAHSLLARGLVQRVESGGGFQVEPSLAALLAVPTRPTVGYEFDLERGGMLTAGAVAADAEAGVLVLPRTDGTVLLRSVRPDELAKAVVDAAGPARPGPARLLVPRQVLAEPLPSTGPEVLRERGMPAPDAATLAALLRVRTGSGRVFAVRRSDLDGADGPDGAAGPGWVSSPLPVAWWDTADGRYLVESVVEASPTGGGAERMIGIRGCTDFELRSALAELATGVVPG